jgi:hypothetical protein
MPMTFGHEDPTCVVGVTDLAEEFLDSSNLSQVSSSMVKGSSNNTLVKTSHDHLIRSEQNQSA